MGECHHYGDYGLGSYAQERHHGPRCYGCGGSHPTEWCNRGKELLLSCVSYDSAYGLVPIRVYRLGEASQLLRQNLPENLTKIC